MDQQTEQSTQFLEQSTPPSIPQSADMLFDEGIKRYQEGENAAVLIPLFEEVCDRAPKNSVALTCLAWLYLLEHKPKRALKAAQKAVKLNPEDLQARINLAIAMLESGQKGVREHIEVAQNLAMVTELREEAEENFTEGLKRRPDWECLERVRRWLLEA